MKKEYLKFTLEELIDDSEFIAWALHGKNQKEWDLFIAENPGFKSTVNTALNIMELFHDRGEHLNPDDILKIWENVDGFDRMIRNRQRKIKIHAFLRYAAVLILALSIGSACYLISSQNQSSYVYKSGLSSGSDKQSRLLLSNGTRVNLEKENSKIALDADKKIVVDNERVIDLSTISSTDESRMNEVVIPFGKKSQLLLEDGTKIWLNAGSRMAFPTKFTGKNREIFLEGEAYFEVAHDQNMPFIVNTGELSIKDLGTKFDLSAYKSDNSAEIVLIEGKVSIKEQSSLGFLKGETILAPNQKASFSRNNHSLTVKNDPDVDCSISWTEGWFKFSHQSLNDVLNQLQRYYNVEFEIGKGFPAVDVITGKLDLKESIEKVMVVLADVASIRYKINGNKIYIDIK
jgi:transmembrane sensor